MNPYNEYALRWHRTQAILPPRRYSWFRQLWEAVFGWDVKRLAREWTRIHAVQINIGPKARAFSIHNISPHDNIHLSHQLGATGYPLVPGGTFTQMRTESMWVSAKRPAKVMVAEYR